MGVSTEPQIPHIPASARIAGLDLLRGACALLVVCFHLAYSFPRKGTADWQVMRVFAEPASFGYLGVECFFIISGFVIAFSARGRSRYEFAVSRVARLIPAFWLSLLLTIAATLLLSSNKLGWSNIASNFTIVGPLLYGYNIDPVYWSLQAEIVFYAFIFIIGGKADFNRRLALMTCMWLVLSIFDRIINIPLDGLTGVRWAPFFCVGVSMYLLSERKGKLSGALLASSVIMAVTYAYLDNMHRVDSSTHSPVIAAVIMAALVTLSIIMVRVDLQGFWHSCAVTLGKLSYPVYLLHAIFTTLIMNYLIGVSIYLAPIALIVGIVVAYVITLIERPCAKLIRTTARKLAIG